MVELMRSPLSKMSPDPATNARGQEKEISVPSTPPPRSPALSNGHRRVSTGKEEDAVHSLMKLATPVKSPAPPCISPRGVGTNGGETTPAANIRSSGMMNCGGGMPTEMTPVSLFRKSRQPGELGQLHSPFQSPFHSFHFSPGCLFSPPGAGTLDIPLAGGDTPGPAMNRDLWHQASIDGTPRDGRSGIVTSIHGINGGVGSGGESNSGALASDANDGRENCAKRKGKALFTDKRGPQDHSHLGQGWCLGTPGRSREGVPDHLGVADIPATPDRVAMDGTQVLPPTPQLLPPTPPTRATDAMDPTGGEGAVGILVGLRSPEVSSAFGAGTGNIADSLFAGLDEGYEGCRVISSQANGGDSNAGHARNGSRGSGQNSRSVGTRDWSGDWNDANAEDRIGSVMCDEKYMGLGQEAPQVLRAPQLPQVPNSAPSKRYRRWASPASSLRNSHCKSSFKIEGTTLIRTCSSSSTGSERSRPGAGGGNCTSDRKQAAGADRSNCRVRSRGQSIAQEPLSPPKPTVASPELPPLTMSRGRSVSVSPAKPPVSRKGGSATGGTCSTISESPVAAPRPSARAMRAEKPRRGPATGAVATVTPSRTMTPSRSTRRSSQQAATQGSIPGATASSRQRADADTSSSSEAISTNATPSQRRSRVNPRLQTSPATSTAAVVSGEAVSVNPTGTLIRAESGDVLGVQPEFDQHGPTTCNCKKSKCLKLYCECFQRRQYCTDCNCQECFNTPATEELRQNAIQSTMERNPAAFVSKFEKRAGGKRSHNAGCNCKKSACLKKYCECFQAGVACASNCKCTNCKNFEGAGGGRKRRATEAAVAAAHQPRTPPRASSRSQRVGATATAGAARGVAESSQFGRFMEPKEVDTSSDSMNVQDGDEEEVEIDGKEKSPPLANVLRGGPIVCVPAQGAVPFTSGSSISNSTAGITSLASLITTSAIGAGSNAVNKPPVVQVGLRYGGRSQGTSPAASAVADRAVARSLLDMGGTPPQVKPKPESADDTAGFKLSVALGDCDGPISGRKDVSARSVTMDVDVGSCGTSSDDAVAGIDPAGVGGGDSRCGEVVVSKRLTYDHNDGATGMNALLSRARSDARANEALMASPHGENMSYGNGEPVGDEFEEVSEASGGLVAAESKTGGKCVTPPTPLVSLPPVATAAAIALKTKLPGISAVPVPGTWKPENATAAESLRRSTDRTTYTMATAPATGGGYGVA